MNSCEKCSKNIDGKYGSGRFCDVHCARSFSSLVNKIETNEKVSKKLKGHVCLTKGIKKESTIQKERLAEDKKKCKRLEFERLTVLFSKVEEKALYKIISVCKGGDYRYCRTEPKHPKRNQKGLYPLHRVLMENKLGRSLGDREEVHHVDENKENDDPDNLEVLTKMEHARYHQYKKLSVEVKCPCGKNRKYKESYVKRNKKTLFCSRRCSLIFKEFLPEESEEFRTS